MSIEVLKNIRGYQLRSSYRKEELSKLDQIESVISEIDCLRKEIEKEQVEIAKERRRAETLISGIGDPVLEEIIHRRYIDAESWRSIAKALGYSESHIYKLHKKAIKKIQDDSK